MAEKLTFYDEVDSDNIVINDNRDNNQNNNTQIIKTPEDLMNEVCENAKLLRSHFLPNKYKAEKVKIKADKFHYLQLGGYKHTAITHLFPEVIKKTNMFYQWNRDGKHFLIQLWKAFQGFDEYFTWNKENPPQDTFDPNTFYWNLKHYRNRHIKCHVDFEETTKAMRLRLNDDIKFHIEGMKKKYRFMFQDNFDVAILKEQIQLFTDTPDNERMSLPFM